MGTLGPGGSARPERDRLLVATRSAHKLRELRELLGLQADLVDLEDVGIFEDAIEDGETFDANAAKKARFFAALSGLPTLADDSSIRSTSVRSNGLPSAVPCSSTYRPASVETTLKSTSAFESSE